MKQIVTNAVVLRRINYQEADRIITLLTSNNGKITAMARGVRKANSKLAGSIELFGTSQVTFLPSKGEINTLISARLIKNYGNIVKNFNKTQLGYEVLKLINKSIESNSDEAIYDLVVDTLEFLNDEAIDINLTKFWFSLRFLILMGHSPNLSVEDSDENHKYNFSLDSMSFVVDGEGLYSKNHIKLLRLALVNNPVNLSKINNLDKIVEKNLDITRLMFIGTGFNPI